MPILPPIIISAHQIAAVDIGTWIVKGIILLVYVETLVLVYRDARSRGKNGAEVAVLCGICAWPVSCVLWMAFRPEIPASQEPVECIHCRSTIPEGESTCPNCGWSYKI